MVDQYLGSYTELLSAEIGESVRAELVVRVMFLSAVNMAAHVGPNHAGAFLRQLADKIERSAH